MTVRQLLNSLDSEELAEWRGFMRIRSGRSEFPKHTSADIKKQLLSLPGIQRRRKKQRKG